MNLNEEKLRYISGFLDDSIEELIYTALDSNGKNCRYSFVTIEKIILCYIDLENALGYSYGCLLYTSQTEHQGQLTVLNSTDTIGIGSS